MSDEEKELEQAVEHMKLLMLRELRANQRKGNRDGWLRASSKELVMEVFHHAAKLHSAVMAGDALQIAEYAADTANMAMMVADKCDVLGMPERPKRNRGFDPFSY